MSRSYSNDIWKINIPTVPVADSEQQLLHPIATYRESVEVTEFQDPPAIQWSWRVTYIRSCATGHRYGRRITVVARTLRTGPDGAIIIDNSGWLTPRPTRKDRIVLSSRAPISRSDVARRKRAGAIRQQDVYGKTRRKERPEIDQSPPARNFEKDV